MGEASSVADGAPTPKGAGLPAAGGVRLDLGALVPWLFIGVFFAFILAFLVVPAIYILAGAFSDGAGGFTLDYVKQLFGPHYRNAYLVTTELAALSALLGTLIGLVTAYIIQQPATPEWLRSLVTSFAGVAANFAGVPLAFAFISTLGTLGVVTVLLKSMGLDIYAAGFKIFDFTGLVITYLYFQIPLMVIIITPAIQGMRKEWREACESLGGTDWHYWRHVAVPILLPPTLAGFILLFGNAFAAYATPYALTSGLIPLVPTEIGNLLSGNVLAAPQLGQALSLGMIVIMALAMILYTLLQRRTARWQQR